MTYHIFLFVYVEWTDFLFWMRTQNRCLGWKGFHSLSHWFTGWALCWSDVGHIASLALWPGFLVTQGWGLNSAVGRDINYLPFLGEEADQAPRPARFFVWAPEGLYTTFPGQMSPSSWLSRCANLLAGILPGCCCELSAKVWVLDVVCPTFFPIAIWSLIFKLHKFLPLWSSWRPAWAPWEASHSVEGSGCLPGSLSFPLEKEWPSWGCWHQPGGKRVWPESGHSSYLANTVLCGLCGQGSASTSPPYPRIFTIVCPLVIDANWSN